MAQDRDTQVSGTERDATNPEAVNSPSVAQQLNAILDDCDFEMKKAIPRIFSITVDGSSLSPFPGLEPWQVPVPDPVNVRRDIFGCLEGVGKRLRLFVQVERRNPPRWIMPTFNPAALRSMRESEHHRWENVSKMWHAFNVFAYWTTRVSERGITMTMEEALDEYAQAEVARLQVGAVALMNDHRQQRTNPAKKHCSDRRGSVSSGTTPSVMQDWRRGRVLQAEDDTLLVDDKSEQNPTEQQPPSTPIKHPKEREESCTKPEHIDGASSPTRGTAAPQTHDSPAAVEAPPPWQADAPEMPRGPGSRSLGSVLFHAQLYYADTTFEACSEFLRDQLLQNCLPDPELAETKADLDGWPTMQSLKRAVKKLVAMFPDVCLKSREEDPSAPAQATEQLGEWTRETHRLLDERRAAMARKASVLRLLKDVLSGPYGLEPGVAQ
jgi:hypothetical protein